MKYKVVFETKATSFALNCPLQLLESRVVQDVKSQTCFLNVRLFSMSKKEVDGVYLKLSVKEVKNRTRVISTFVFSPNKGAGIIKNEQPFAFFVGEVQNIEISVVRVNYSDGSFWKTDKSVVCCQLPEKVSLENFDKYLPLIKSEFEINQHIVCGFSENDDVWRCTCGCVNQDSTCFACGCDKVTTRNIFDKERLNIQYAWALKQEECFKNGVAERDVLEKSATLSREFDAILPKVRSQKSTVIGEAIYAIEQIQKEELFYKKVQAEEMLALAQTRFERRKTREIEYKNAITAHAEQLAEGVRIRKAKERRRKILITALSSTCAVLAVLFISAFYVMTNIIIPSWEYESGRTSFENGEYQTALEMFESLGDYEDSPDMVIESKYQIANELVEGMEFVSARTAFGELGSYKDSQDRLYEIDKLEGESLLEKGEYQSALEYFALVSDLDGVSQMQSECLYQLAINAMNKTDLDSALELFLQAPGYENSDAYVVDIMKSKAESYYNSGDFGSLIAMLQDRDEDFVAGYMAEIVPIYEANARAFYDDGQYLVAKDMYLLLANSTEWLPNETAINRVKAYPIFCDARLYRNNYQEVEKVFGLSYESYNVIEEVPGYMLEFLKNTQWIYYSSTGLDETRYLRVDSYGYATYYFKNVGSAAKGYLTYSDGYIYIDGSKVIEMEITSFSSITATVNKTEFVYVKAN